MGDDRGSDLLCTFEPAHVEMTKMISDWLDHVIDDTIEARLDRLNDLVPDSRCPTWCSRCCQLSDVDLATDLAVMYPLYRVEYFRIARHVRDHFPPAEAHRLFNFREERPRACAFLDLQTNGCRLYPVRPYLCRTYGVLSRAEIDAIHIDYADKLPIRWRDEFKKYESELVCDDILSVSDDNKPAFIDHRIRGLDIRELHKLNQDCRLHPREKDGRIKKITGKPIVQIWSWGGFNALFMSDNEWFDAHFADYWQNAELPW